MCTMYNVQVHAAYLIAITCGLKYTDFVPYKYPLVYTIQCTLQCTLQYTLYSIKYTIYIIHDVPYRAIF